VNPEGKISLLRPWKRLGQVRTQKFFLGGGQGVGVSWGGLTQAMYNLYLILKIMLQKPCCKHNITLPATAFIYTQI
jgi:hypothetical protein